MKKHQLTQTACHLLSAFFILIALLLVSPLTANAAAKSAANVTSALIQGSNVVVSSQGLAASDDGIYHLFAQMPYESGIQGVEVAQAPAADGAVFTFPLGQGTAASNLYKKFTILIAKGGNLVSAGSSRYITNPEALATHTFARSDIGKKGLLPAAEIIDSTDLATLGVQQITYNIPIGNLCAGTGINYTYNGKTYTFSRAIVGQYDHLVPLMNAQNIQVTLVILNNRTADQSLLHPLSRGYNGAGYYAFNTAEQTGVERFAAICAFFAERYDGTKWGRVDNWVVGNEANARQEWHYMTPSAGIDTQVQEYEKSVRIAYNAIKSTNANARIYISLDREWAGTDFADRHYPGRPFLVKFNDYAKSEGDYQWDLAIHPYNVKIYDPKVWVSNAQSTHSQNSAFVTMRNIDIVTDLMCTKQFLAPNGQVRSIFISEVGYSSLMGEQQQAAAIIYGYMQCLANQHIDGYIYFREKDDPSEVALSLASGLLNLSGSHKLSWEWYRNAGDPTIQKQAAAVMGASSIQSLLTPR